MAIRANRIVMRQTPVCRVVKRCVQPAGRVVARRAGRWKTCCDVIRHIAAKRRRALPCSRVAAVAVGR